MRNNMKKFYPKEILALKREKVVSTTTTTISSISIGETHAMQSRSSYYSGEEDESIQYLRIFFNFGYFFHYLPYRFRRSSNGAYVSTSSLIHKIICGLIHIFTLFRFITVLREVEITGHDPTSYFVIVRNVATCIYMFTFMYSFWRNESTFKLIFQEIHESHVLFHGAVHQNDKARSYLVGGRKWPKINITTIAYLLCSLYTFISILNVLCGHGFLRISEWSLESLLAKHKSYTEFMFFLKPATSTNISSQPHLDDPYSHYYSSSSYSYKIPLYFLTALHLTIHFYFKLGAHYADLSILICALTLQHLTNAFAASLVMKKKDEEESEQMGNMRIFTKTQQSIQPAKFLEQYSALKNLAKNINSGIGPVTLCCMLEAMPYYATHIGDILKISQDWFVRFRYLFFILNFCSIVFISADVSHKVGSLQEWLNEDFNYNSIPQSKLIVLTNELTYSRIGLSAMGLFTITYGFIGSLVSVVVTYVVIILQFKTSLEACQSVHFTSATEK